MEFEEIRRKRLEIQRKTKLLNELNTKLKNNNNNDDDGDTGTPQKQKKYKSGFFENWKKNKKTRTVDIPKSKDDTEFEY